MAPSPSSPASAPSAAPAGAADGSSAHSTKQESASQAWRQVLVQLGQVRAFAGHYLQSKIDAVKLTIRQLVIFAVLGAVGLVALATIAVMMVVYLFQGIAGAFAELFDGRLWLGELVTMGIFALLLLASGSMALGAIRKAGRMRTVQKYESRQSQQRVNFGTDVHHATGEPDAELTEAQFLQREAADAKTAAARALNELKSQIVAGIDPRGWVEDHPWLTLTGVAAASFVATSAVVPSKEQQALNKLAAIEAAMHRTSRDSSAKSNGHSDGKPSKSLLAMVLIELLGILKPVVGAFVTGMMRSSDEKENPPTSPFSSSH